MARNSIQNSWNKVPVLLRAILLGTLISLGGVFIWTLVASTVPMPWGFLLMILLLGLYIKYFSGSWKPRSTQEFRKTHFRSTRIDKSTWLLAILGIALIVLIEQAGLVVTFRLMDFPADKFIQEYYFLQNIPQWAGWLVIIMISAVAAICEEIGFRGYMQLPLEKRYGPIVSIAIVSIVFVLVHIHQAWSGPILVHIFFISVLFGSIAYFTRSLIPGIIAHFLMDVCNFSFWWSDLGRQFNRDTIHESGIDQHFIFWTVILILAIVAFVLLMRKLNKKIIRPKEG